MNNCLGEMRRRLATGLGEDALSRTAGGFELRLDADRIDAHALAGELRLGRAGTEASPESLGVLMTRLSDLAREVAFRLEAGV